jgi:3-hydroxyacyl-CoA dehydrogenase
LTSQQESSLDRSHPGKSIVGVKGTGLMGVDISTHLMPELAKDEDVIDLLREQVDAGRVGVRSGAGFYDRDDALVERVKAGRRQVISRF